MTSVRRFCGLAVLFIGLAAAFDEPVHAVADGEDWQARSGYWAGRGMVVTARGTAIVRLAVVFVGTVVVASTIAVVFVRTVVIFGTIALVSVPTVIVVVPTVVIAIVIVSER